jgi:hypothetical protein
MYLLRMTARYDEDKLASHVASRMTRQLAARVVLTEHGLLVEDHDRTSSRSDRAARCGSYPRRSLRGIDGQLDSALNAFGLGFRPTCLDGDRYRIFHWIFESHLDPEQSVLVGRFGFVGLHRPTQG